MSSKKLGPYTLSGLIVGPILGSGIVIIPPIVYDILKDYSIFAWVIMMTIGGVFAYFASKLCLKFPGDSGLTEVVGHSFGKSYKNLNAYYLLIAMAMAPLVVIMVAGEYLSVLFSNYAFGAEFYSAVLMLIGGIILSRNISSVGKISMLISTVISTILVVGGLFTILFYRKDALFTGTGISTIDVGYSFLIMFWSIIGWEILGNYSLEVENPEKTIPKAALVSVIAMSIVYLIVSGALQVLDIKKLGLIDPISGISLILYPLFGQYSSIILSLTITGLCLCSFLMLIGGASRLVYAQAKDGVFPKIFKYRSNTNAPLSAVLLMVFANFLTLFAVYFNLISFNEIIAAVNAFLITNIIMAAVASIKVFENVMEKGFAVFLLVSFLLMFLFSSKMVILIILAMLFGTVVYTLKNNNYNIK
ncbi:APC family permease [Methanococcus maripaludis]|uniref:APC family permease n=3 Tax=Methanococcus maripaludis TaxID=39152 RepID=A0A8T3W5H4_METMI|nr:APC family permease [Methanococcus maripaludis]AEK19858.1 amino acid transporter [Methanococcus maripaludis X1]MBG0768423.1 APC family permease [Methanococcus maripaludis]MDK2928610.1 basic amino acid/polyamine antiporter, family [Methanococcus sp.]BAP61059.1 putative amino acid permease [Methanococcus maripaludis KA1]